MTRLAPPPSFTGSGGRRAGRLPAPLRRTADLVEARAGRARALIGPARPGLRRELLTVDYLLPVRARRPGAEPLALRTASTSAHGTVYFGRESFPVDRVAYFGVFLEGWYRADYRDAVVVDVGGHKGYYGAFAMLEGAAEVHSFEPEPANFALLERAARTFGHSWLVRQVAVGAATGEADLYVSAESAGHSLVHRQADGSRRTLETRTVPVVAMCDVLAHAMRDGRRAIVKVDAEGAECGIVLGTPIELWRCVDHVLLEIHDFAPCSGSEIIEHLGRAGFEVTLHVADEGADLVGLERPRRA